MSYDDAIEAMRNRAVQPAPLEAFRAKQAAAATGLTSPQVRTARIATAVAVAAFVVLAVAPATRASAVWVDDVFFVHPAAILPLFVLVWAYRRAPQARLGAQFMCRSVWWSSLVVGLLVSMNYGHTLEKATGAVTAVACAVALRAVGETGLDIREADHPFAPVRFRGHLLLALVMASADALTLSFSGLIQIGFGMRGWNVLGAAMVAGPTLIAAMVMGVAVWGVYRLRTWALFLNLIANIAIAYFALDGTLGLSPSVSVALSATAAIQCFIPVPILAVALGDRNAGEPLLAPARRRLMHGAITLLAGMSVLMVFASGRDGWVDGPGRAFRRGLGATPFAGTVRARLHAEGDDLRGRSFDSAKLRNARFVGVDMRGASLRNAGGQKSLFENADLRRADFRLANLGDGPHHAKFVSVDIRGADFTGAIAGPAFWAQFSPQQLDGVRCPDGALAGAVTGCEGKMGLLEEPVMQRMRMVFPSHPDAEHSPTLDVTTDSQGRLHCRFAPYVRLQDGTFVSGRNILTIGEDGVWRNTTMHLGPFSSPSMSMQKGFDLVPID